MTLEEFLAIVSAINEGFKNAIEKQREVNQMRLIDADTCVKGLEAIKVMLSYDERHSPEQLEVHLNILNTAIEKLKEVIK